MLADQGSMGTYQTVLTIDPSLDVSIVGTYSCIVGNGKGELSETVVLPGETKQNGTGNGAGNKNGNACNGLEQGYVVRCLCKIGPGYEAIICFT